MPAYNCEEFIKEAIEAVLKQTYTDFEFIIINDGSTDATKECILMFSDIRIKYFENEKNLGIVKTLNRGLIIARGEYIVRTDADDITLIDMVEDLVNFLDSHSNYIVCGGNMKLIGSEKYFIYPSDNESLKVHALNFCPFSHSTVIFRRKILIDNNIYYDSKLKDAEDYGLWSSLLLLGKFHNLEKITLLYRESKGQVTSQDNYNHNLVFSLENIYKYHAVNYFKLDHNDLSFYSKIIKGERAVDFTELKKCGETILKVLQANSLSHYFNQKKLKYLFFIKWYHICKISSNSGLRGFIIYLSYLSKSKSLIYFKSIFTFLFSKTNY